MTIHFKLTILGLIAIYGCSDSAKTPPAAYCAQSVELCSAQGKDGGDTPGTTSLIPAGDGRAHLSEDEPDTPVPVQSQPDVSMSPASVESQTGGQASNHVVSSTIEADLGGRAARDEGDPIVEETAEIHDAGGRPDDDPAERPDAGGRPNDEPAERPDAGGRPGDAPGEKYDAGDRPDEAPADRRDVGGRLEEEPAERQDTGGRPEEEPAERYDAGGSPEEAPAERQDASGRPEEEPAERYGLNEEPDERHNAGGHPEEEPAERYGLNEQPDQRHNAGGRPHEEPAERQDAGGHSDEAPAERDDVGGRPEEDPREQYEEGGRPDEAPKEQGPMGGDLAHGNVPPAEPNPCDAPQDPGRVRAHRLNRVEYDLSVRAVFEIDHTPAQEFLPDPVVAGFTNNAAQLSVNQRQAEQYLDAAETIITQALTERRNELITCNPNDIGHDPCVRQIIRPIAELAFRRPLRLEEENALIGLVAQAERHGDSFEAAIGLAFQGILVSPQFLYRIIESRGQPGEVIPLNDFELASRLSYFLWKSGPDTQLLEAARQGLLTRGDGLTREVGRMLLDPKAGTLIHGFVDQWLHLGTLAGAVPNPALFPQFNESLRQAMRQETLRFAQHVFENNMSPFAFIDADYTYADDQVADLYGVAPEHGLGHRLTDLSTLDRSGILSHPSILTMTSQSNETSVIRRGVWILENILCSPVPSPPENAELVLPERRDNETLRERLERHRGDPACAGCHRLIDPIGFGFEHFDPIGREREDDAFGPVDNLGSMPDGMPFTGPKELAARIKENGQFQTCFVRKLFTYALGRLPQFSDRCAISDVAESIDNGDGIHKIIERIITSEMFRFQRNEDHQ